MAEALAQNGPHIDFSPGPDLHQRCLDWIEEVELMCNGPLQSKSSAVKANYVKIWAGKTGRQHIKSLHPTEAQNANPTWIMEQLKN